MYIHSNIIYWNMCIYSGIQNHINHTMHYCNAYKLTQITNKSHTMLRKITGINSMSILHCM